jgi:hypothetical protein
MNEQGGGSCLGGDLDLIQATQRDQARAKATGNYKRRGKKRRKKQKPAYQNQITEQLLRATRRKEETGDDEHEELVLTRYLNTSSRAVRCEMMSNR